MLTNLGLPDWRDERVGGTRIRIALWLAQEVREGGIFRKADLRAAFPGVEQADRRMRDLRDAEWVIATVREDAELNPEELRLVKIGLPVWDKTSRVALARQRLTGPERQSVLRKDDYTCIYCGISAGERYMDDNSRTAKLKPADVGGGWRTVCDKCASGAVPVSAEEVLAAAVQLGETDRQVLRRWLAEGRRGRVDAVWASYRRLPSDVQQEVRRRLVND